MSDERGVVVLTVTCGGERVDRYVAAAFEDLSRTAVQRLVEAGAITVNGGAVQASYKVQVGDRSDAARPQRGEVIERAVWPRCW